MSNHNQVDQARTNGIVVQVVLWLALASSAAVNSLGYFFGLHDTWRLAAGGVSVLCIALLVAFYLKRRSR
ncbi:hypothetical protein AB0I60_06245 [Actinosynnema sp. NPDC050436]|uniref:hypothetical protein n=1 Tax=Actinosynnema sp. NPDC050436 TaxID=3155659 RepID=UPI0033DAD3BA